MSLASTADAKGTEIYNALNALAKGENKGEEAWQIVCQKLAAWIAAEGKATIPTSAIATSGSSTNQVGPPAPVLLSIT